LTDSSPQSGTPDSEGQFYTALRHSLGTDRLDFAAITRDFFDASEGPQCGLRADGTPVLVLTFTPQGVKLVLDSVRYWQDHNCEHGADMGIYLLHVIAAHLEPLMEHLPQVKDYEPFAHKTD
jgi:hypothetical protein